MRKLSLCMIVKNEEKHLERCLNSCAKYVQEMIIVDTGSTDRTIEIAEKFGAKIFHYEWDNNFSNARNYSIKKSTGDFNLILDADEVIVGLNEGLLKKFMKMKNVLGVVKRIDFFHNVDNNKISKSVCTLPRIIPKNVFYRRPIHEQVNSSLPVMELDIQIEHFGYLEDLNLKVDRNIEIILSELDKNPNDNYMLYQAAQTYFSAKNYEEATKWFDKYIEKANPPEEPYYRLAFTNAMYSAAHIHDYDRYLLLIMDNFDILGTFCDFWYAAARFYSSAHDHDINKYGHLRENILMGYQLALKVGEPDLFDGVAGTGTILPAYNLYKIHEILGEPEKSQHYYGIYKSFLDTGKYGSIE